MSLFQKKDHRQEFINRLKEDYINELQLARQMKYHAETARYKQFKDKLYQLSKSENNQAETLRGILEKLGSDIPADVPPVTKEKNRNLFQALNRDLEMDHQDYFHYLERIFEAEDEGLTELIPKLNQLREDEADHHETILSILQKLNPYQV